MELKLINLYEKKEFNEIKSIVDKITEDEVSKKLFLIAFF